MIHNKKIYSKTSFFKWTTFIGILSILLLQVISLFSIYSNLHKIIENNIQEAFLDSMKEYRDLEFQKNYNKDLEFKIENTDKSVEKKTQNVIDKYDYTNKLPIDDVMDKVIGIIIDEQNIPVNIYTLDSIFNKNLKEREIVVPFGITVSTIEKDSILSQSENFNKSNFNYQTPKVDFDIKRQIGASFKHVDKVILGKILWYVITSFIIIIVVAIFLVYQLKIIMMQKKIEKIRQDFVDSMTHELKQPLQGALSLTQILENSNFSNNEEQRNYAISKIKHNLKQINLSIESILEKSHSNDIEYIPNLNLENIVETINNIITNISISNNQKNINFTTKFDISQHFYFFDSLHFPNAIKNIVENAVKYSKKDVIINIDINVYNKNNHLVIEVKDNGIGIKKNDLDLIFNKFYRVQQIGYGFGLGLSYVKWVCNAHNGDVQVKSNYGEGSLFTIKIPILK